MTQETAPLLDWAVAARTLAGEVESGDRHCVQSFANGVLVAAVDGLGHGEEAALAAQTAVATLQGHAHEPLLDLLQRCHHMLRPTRGAVMSLVSFRGLDQALNWVGVGDVEGMLLRPGPGASLRKQCLLLRGGVVGYQLPPLHVSQVPVRPGDLLLLATDGIRGGFADRLSLQEPPRQLAEHILAEYSRDTDDSLILVARYLGQPT